MSKYQQVELLLQELKKGASTRTSATLDKIHETCRKQFEEHKSTDFKISTIANLLPDRKPSEGAIRNKSGEPYRALIAAWEKVANKGNVKTKTLTKLDETEKALKTIQDSGLRALALSVYSQLKRERIERIALKHIVEKDHVIDLVGTPKKPEQLVYSPKEVVDLAEHEIEALRHFISEEGLAEQGLRLSPSLTIETERGAIVYEPGLASAIMKVIALYTD